MGRGKGQVSLQLSRPGCFSVVGNIAVNIMILTESPQWRTALAFNFGAQRKPGFAR